MSTAGSGFRQRHQRGLANTRDSHGSFGFDPSVGGLPMGVARDGEQSNTPDIAPGAIDGEVHIQPGTIVRSLFASTIIPPEVVDVLPTLPDADYPQGVLVFLTTDEKLYRNTDGSTWSVAVDGADIIANSITAGQIAAGAIGTTELAADAVIANVVNVGGTVTIDDTGITITGGAMTLIDQFGSNVLTGAGFGASWLDFISEGFYNGHFAVGTTTNIVAATLVGTASTEADYLASLSADVPYWVVSSESGAGTFRRAADSNAVGGFALQWGGSEDATVFQDIPVQPGRNYNIIINWRYTNSSSEFSREFGYQFRKSDHSAIGLQVDQALAFTGSQSNYVTEWLGETTVAPANARYLRVFIHVSRTSGSPTVYVSQITASGSATVVSAVVADGSLNNPRFIVEDLSGNWGAVLEEAYLAVGAATSSNFGIELVAGSSSPLIRMGSESAAADVYISRSAAKTLLVDTDGAGGALTLMQIAGPLRSEGLQLGTTAAPPSIAGIALGATAQIYPDATTGTLIKFTNNIAPAGYVAASQLTANQNDWNPGANFHRSFLMVVSSDASRTLTGLVAGIQGEVHLLSNQGGFDIVFAQESASSSAANRFRCPGAANFTLNQKDSVFVVYDALSANPRWLVVAF